MEFQPIMYVSLQHAKKEDVYTLLHKTLKICYILKYFVWIYPNYKKYILKNYPLNFIDFCNNLQKYKRYRNLQLKLYTAKLYSDHT